MSVLFILDGSNPSAYTVKVGYLNHGVSVSDTLAGRMALFELMPFSQREYRLDQGNFVDLLFESSVNELPVADMGRRDIIDAGALCLLRRDR